jgi:hypothetical protein
MLKSKTVWFNIVGAAVAVVSSLSGNILPADVSAIIIAIGNIISRSIKK